MTPVIETDLLILREMEAVDLYPLHRIFSDAETMKHYPAPFDLEKTKSWIERNQKRYQTDGFGLWAVVLKETGELIGDCGITMQNIHGRLVPEIGYHIDKRFWNKGYATQAARACLRYAFEKTSFGEVYCYQKYTNAASRRVAEKIGMTLCEEYADDVNIKTTVYSVKKAL